MSHQTAKIAKAPAVKLTATDKLYYRWWKDHLDLYDYGHTFVTITQPLNAQVERHLNSSPRDFTQRLDKLTARQLARHRRGQETLHFRPRWNSTRPSVVVRFDADAHHGETDASALIEWMNETYFDGKLYVEPTPRGVAAYAKMNLIRYEAGDDSGRYWFDSKRQVNRLLADLQSALLRQCLDRNFAATIQIQGGFSIFGTLDDGTRKLLKRIPMGRAPRVAHDGDVHRLIASSFSCAVVHDIIAHTAPSRLVTKPIFISTAGPPAKPTELKKVRASPRYKHIADTGDKHANRVKCVTAARREILNTAFDPSTVTSAERVRIVERANAIYESNLLAGHERDTARMKAFQRILDWELRTYDPRIAGSGLWFTVEDDLSRAQEFIRSKMSAARLSAVNVEHEAKLRCCKVTYFTLALALCTISKNAVTSGGAVPSRSIGGMLKYFGVRSNGSLVSLLVKTLTDMGLIKCMSKSYRAGGWCRKYSPTGVTWTLPFLVDLKADDAVKLIASDQARKYLGRGAFAETRPAEHSKYLHTSIQFTHPCQSDPELYGQPYWQSLLSLEQEYLAKCEN